MLNNAGTTTLGLVKYTTGTLLSVLWNTFKIALSAVFLLLAWFAAWGVWERGALGFGAVAVIAFLFFVACAPWVIPRLSLPGKPAPLTVAISGFTLALACLDLAYSALAYGWKADACASPGALFCYGMNLLHSLGGNALIALAWLGAAVLILRCTIRAAARAAQKTRARAETNAISY